VRRSVELEPKVSFVRVDDRTQFVRELGPGGSDIEAHTCDGARRDDAMQAATRDGRAAAE
jgi:hypothetical protein